MTRIQQAKKGILSDDVRLAAEKESLDPERLNRAVARGTATVVRNTLHDITPLAIGSGTRIKINANIGTSSSRASVEEEMEKMRVSVKYGPLHCQRAGIRAIQIHDHAPGGALPALNVQRSLACGLGRRRLFPSREGIVDRRYRLRRARSRMLRRRSRL